jgi:hypothetical protein
MYMVRSLAILGRRRRMTVIFRGLITLPKNGVAQNESSSMYTARSQARFGFIPQAMTLTLEEISSPRVFGELRGDDMRLGILKARQ